MKEKINAFLDTPWTIRRSIKATLITYAVALPLWYAWCAYEGYLPNPKEVADDVKEKYIELRRK